MREGEREGERRRERREEEGGREGEKREEKGRRRRERREEKVREGKRKAGEKAREGREAPTCGQSPDVLAGLMSIASANSKDVQPLSQYVRPLTRSAPAVISHTVVPWCAYHWRCGEGRERDGGRARGVRSTRREKHEA